MGHLYEGPSKTAILAGQKRRGSKNINICVTSLTDDPQGTISRGFLNYFSIEPTTYCCIYSQENIFVRILAKFFTYSGSLFSKKFFEGFAFRYRKII